MKRIILLMALLVPGIVSAQRVPEQPVFFVDSAVREKQAKLFDRKNPVQRERATCYVFKWGDMQDGRRYVDIFGAIPAVVIEDSLDLYSITFSCPDDMPQVVSGHVHTPTTCESENGITKKETCRIGGDDAWQCEPSPYDRETLAESGEPFRVIQCDEYALVPYWNPALIDSLNGVRRRSSVKPTVVAAGLLTAGVVAVRAFNIDADTGGYRDRWTTTAAVSDKAVHTMGGFLLTSVQVDIGVRPWVAGALSCLAGVGYEVAQSYVSYYDIGANCIGATVGALWRTKFR